MMKKPFFVLCTLFWGFVPWMNADTGLQVKTPIDPNKPLKIVFDNDVHGAIDRYEYLTGYRDALVKDGYPVLTVSVGDYLQGSAYAAVSEGQFCVDMMNAVDYDVMAVGNHDLDYGLARLMEMRDSLSTAALVCANLLNADNKPVLPPFIVCKVGNYSVAFVGVLTTATQVLEAYAAFDKQGNRLCSFAQDSLVTLVQHAVDEARLTNPDWVVLLTHMGEEPLEEHMSSWQLLEQLHGVDLVLDGHSHSVVSTQLMVSDRETPVVLAQTGSGLNNVGCVTLMHGETPRVQLYAYQNLPQSQKVHWVYQQVVGQMQPILGQVEGYTPFELCYRMNGERAVRHQETNLGDLVADAYRQSFGTDIGWVNGGGIRTGIMMGDITYGQILSVSPFNNFMCVVQVTGQQLMDALEECYNKCPADLGSFAQISGLRCVVDTTVRNELEWSDTNELQVKGSRRVSDIEINKDGKWQVVDPKQVYTIASTEYVVYKGESRGLRNAKILRDKVMTDTECLQRYIVNTLEGNIPALYATPQGRIVFKKQND